NSETANIRSGNVREICTRLTGSTPIDFVPIPKIIEVIQIDDDDSQLHPVHHKEKRAIESTDETSPHSPKRLRMIDNASDTVVLMEEESNHRVIELEESTEDSDKICEEKEEKPCDSLKTTVPLSMETVQLLNIYRNLSSDADTVDEILESIIVTTVLSQQVVRSGTEECERKEEKGEEREEDKGEERNEERKEIEERNPITTPSSPPKEPCEVKSTVTGNEKIDNKRKRSINHGPRNMLSVINRQLGRNQPVHKQRRSDSKTDTVLGKDTVVREEIGDVLPEVSSILEESRMDTVTPDDRLRDSSFPPSGPSTVILPVPISTGNSSVSIVEVKKEILDEVTVVRPVVDRGEDVTTMAMNEKGASKVISGLKRMNLEDRNLVFQCIQESLLQLAMDANGHRVVQWFISHGTSDQRSHITSISTANIVPLVECGGYGRSTIECVIDNCLDSDTRASLKAEFARALDASSLIGDGFREMMKEVKKEVESDDEIQVIRCVPAPKKAALAPTRSRALSAPSPRPVDPSRMLDQTEFMKRLHSIISTG
ncbi:hypothetical protein PFISCL1PPCAC_25116, partial [Pristionchus fissidentatus]